MRAGRYSNWLILNTKVQCAFGVRKLRQQPDPIDCIPVSTYPHASSPTRRLCLRPHLGLQSEGFIPIRRTGQGGVMRVGTYNGKVGWLNQHVIRAYKV